MARIVLIDNYDSFTHNIKNELQQLGASVALHLNDAVSVMDVKHMKPTHIVISPGPGTPKDAGITLALIRSLFKDIPILGICLGHQAIAALWGGNVVKMKSVVHGKNTIIAHDGKGLFSGLPKTFSVTRYHSLAVDESSLSKDIIICAHTADDNKTIMGIRHREYPVFGIQYHPEAILTEHGNHIFKQFLSCARHQDR